MTVRRTTWFAVAVAVIVVVMAVLQISSVRQESQTVDEGVHLAAGYSYWKTGDFRLNPEHPPLVKLLASVPLLFLPLQLPTDHPSWERRDQWAFAREFLYRNTVPADTLLFLGRLPVIILSLALAVVVGLWARSLWGFAGGLLALILLAFDPTFLAHSRYVTTDLGVTLWFFVSTILFARYLDEPSHRRFWPVAITFAFAQLSKFSATILWFIFPLLWLARAVRDDHRRDLGFRNALIFFLGLFLITHLIVFAVYGFEFRPPLSDPQFASVYHNRSLWSQVNPDEQPPVAEAVLRLTDPATPLGSTLRGVFATVPLPAYTYFRGLSSVLWHNYWGHSSYLLGETRSTGWWYYFPIAWFVKTPPTKLLLLLLAILYLGRLLRHRTEHYQRKQAVIKSSPFLTAFRSADFQYITLILPPLVYFLVSLTSNINLGVRHLLPIYPFLAVLTASLVTVRFRALQWLWQTSFISIIALFLASSALIYPYYLSYFSELVGGARAGARYLVDSNLDWGQELKRLGAYLKKRHIPFVYTVYFGQAPLETYLDDARYLPTSKEPEAIAALDGWAAISATALFSMEEYAWLRERHPTEKIGYAIFLYDLRKP